MKPAGPGQVGAAEFSGRAQRHPGTAQKCPEGQGERKGSSGHALKGLSLLNSFPPLLPLHFLCSVLPQEGPCWQQGWDAAAQIPYHAGHSISASVSPCSPLGLPRGVVESPSLEVLKCVAVALVDMV